MSGRLAGRRMADPGLSRRPGRLLLTGAVAVAVTVAALVVQSPAAEQGVEPDTAPVTEPLTSVALGCPAGLGPGSNLLVAPVGAREGPGEVTSRVLPGQDEAPVPVRAGETATVPDGGAAVVTGRGSLAPGLLAARLGADGRPALGECRTPVTERWYVGVGAGAGHTSRLLLVNPDDGPAVADVTLWGTEGPLERVQSRGLTIPASGSTVLDLEEIAPHRNELAMRVVVERGRLAASVQDTYAPAGSNDMQDWLGDGSAPAEVQLLPGLPRLAEEQTLTLANPGESEGRVRVQIVGGDSTFAPSGVSDIRVPAGRVVVTDLTDALVAQLGGEDAALLVTGTVPVVAGLRTVVAGDVAHVPGLVAEEMGTAAALVPRNGRSVLVLAGAESAARVVIQFEGTRAPRRVRLRPDTSLAVPVPAGTRYVTVTGGAELAGAVRTVAGNGVALAPLRELVVDELLPSVRPAWP